MELDFDLNLIAKRKRPLRFLGDQRPVVNVNGKEALGFCPRLRIRAGKNDCLPSEAPWDYACRPDHFILLTPPHLPAKLRNSGT